MITKQNIDDILNSGGHVVGPDGHKIGSIGQFYVDDDSGRPTWVTTKTGLFGTSASFVPLTDARVEGNDVHVPYDKDTVKDAPRTEADSQLSPEEEDRLYEHYRVADSTGAETETGAETKTGTHTDGTYSGVTTGTDDMRGERTGTHLSDDDFGERSSMERQEAPDRTRLRKYVVTDRDRDDRI